ncbi:hypothetical protein ACIQHU_35775 [Streptomyces tendae]|uniref:hypothetical protein n=1 Tax=Streptomyces tendae TaxID=1932 RepID=UPI003424FAD4
MGDAYDNALMENTIGLFETELINPRRPWKTLSDVEFATAEYVDWHETPGHTQRLRSLPNPERFTET